MLLMSVTSIFSSGRTCGPCASITTGAGLEFIQCAPRLAREPRLGEQVGPALGGAGHRLLEPPAADVFMISRQQHRWHAPPFEHLGARIVRPLEQALHKRIVKARALIAQRARALTIRLCRACS